MSSENRRPVDSTKSDQNGGETGRIAATKRLQKELMDFVLNSDQSMTAFPDGDNLFRWIATITGPKDTQKLPNFKFNNDGFIGKTRGKHQKELVTKDKWTALYDVRTILISIQSLLGDFYSYREPNLDSPLDALAAEKWGHEDYKQLVLLFMAFSHDILVEPIIHTFADYCILGSFSASMDVQRVFSMVAYKSYTVPHHLLIEFIVDVMVLSVGHIYGSGNESIESIRRQITVLVIEWLTIGGLSVDIGVAIIQRQSGSVWQHWVDPYGLA
ncbi:unnamed protein product [Oppiella nova]|uniref:Uncharacterized protein n=1 Tax=Oppiella nova TaxID=334625 RepID=A0A7R9LID2_9ACAR|nr:unnamed protein product [Oppiella nova]CAG2163968.1 unnamed protein product [Oppiella nova]